MATEERLVKILAWPEQPAKLSHQFESGTPCPVSIGFEPAPAHVSIETTPKTPLYVDMAMRLSAEKPVPICIRLCEPICAESEYTIGIQIFDRPVATITLRGKTRFFNCEEKE